MRLMTVAGINVERHVCRVECQCNCENPANAKFLWLTRVVVAASRAAVNFVADPMQYQPECEQQARSDQNWNFVIVDQSMKGHEAATKTDLATCAHNRYENRQATAENVGQFRDQAGRSRHSLDIGHGMLQTLLKDRKGAGRPTRQLKLL